MIGIAEELTDDAIAGSFRIYQRRRGHRYSIDDVCTAFVAVRGMREAPERCLDLGCGIGSVLLMVAYKFPDATFVGIEAQRVSFDLAVRNVERNGLGSRTTLVHGDLRDSQLLAAHGPFDLVTGTPPYAPAGTSTPSPDPQRAAARVELRGGVEEYLRAASKVLAPHGTVVVCCDARTPERVMAGAAAVDLEPRDRVDVLPRESLKGPLFSVWTLVRGRLPSAFVIQPPIIARDERGGRTDMAREMRRFFGLPVNGDEAPSP